MSKLTFVFSSMNAGKSLAILTKNYMLNERGFVTMLMKPALDNRSEGITTRLGLQADCVSIGISELASEYILKASQKKPDYILIDEAQFLTEKQVWDLCAVVDNWGINIYCYGLKLTWQGDFFEGSEALMKHADALEQVETFCKYNAGAPALYHIKHGGGDSAVETGYEDLYESVSRKEWTKWKKTLDNDH